MSTILIRHLYRNFSCTSIILQYCRPCTSWQKIVLNLGPMTIGIQYGWLHLRSHLAVRRHKIDCRCRFWSSAYKSRQLPVLLLYIDCFLPINESYLDLRMNLSIRFWRQFRFSKIPCHCYLPNLAKNLFTLNTSD